MVSDMKMSLSVKESDNPSENVKSSGRREPVTYVDRYGEPCSPSYRALSCPNTLGPELACEPLYERCHVIPHALHFVR